MFSLPEAAEISLKMYGVDGRLIKAVLDDRKEKGSYNLPLDVRGLPSGTYFIILRKGEITSSQPITITR